MASVLYAHPELDGLGVVQGRYPVVEVYMEQLLEQYKRTEQMLLVCRQVMALPKYKDRFGAQLGEIDCITELNILQEKILNFNFRLASN